MRTQDGGFHRRSQNHKRLHFGLAQNSLVAKVEVRWPGGNVDTFFNIPVNRIITINEAGNPDIDGDGILDIADNCINDTNPTQENFDNDEQGDECDADDNNDGVLDQDDAFPLDSTRSVAESDGGSDGGAVSLLGLGLFSLLGFARRKA